MNRWIFGSLLVCLLVLSSTFLATSRASAHPASLSGAQGTITPISLSRLQTLVRQTLGQQAVDHMGRLVTLPPSVSAAKQPNQPLSKTTKAPSSHVRANTTWIIDFRGDTDGYMTNAEGTSWVQGAGGFFHVARVASPVEVDTAIAVADPGQSAQIEVGVNQTNGGAYLAFEGWFKSWLFPVNQNDQMDTEIYWDGNTNQWLVFIEDLTTRTAFGQEFGYDSNYPGMVRAAWYINVQNGGPAPSMNPVTFTNARWLSNWDGWQPIWSPAAASVTVGDLHPANGGSIMTGGLDSSDTSFTLTSTP